MNIETLSLQNLKKDPRNARLHDKANIEAIKNSLRQFGQQKPIVVDAENVIVAGNGTFQAASELGWSTIQAVRSNLDAKALKAFAIADNRTAELGAWDEAVLIDLLQEIDLVPQDLGFDDNFFQKLQLPLSEHDLPEEIAKKENREIHPYKEAEQSYKEPDPFKKYTGKITIPLYKPTLASSPEISSLYNKEKALLLIEKIKQSSVSEELKDFLIFASYRHTSFSFSKIAEFYAHASEEEQNLFEESALVIIDFQKAIEQGFVKVSTEIEELSKAQLNNKGGVDTKDNEEN